MDKKNITDLKKLIARCDFKDIVADISSINHLELSESECEDQLLEILSTSPDDSSDTNLQSIAVDGDFINIWISVGKRVISKSLTEAPLRKAIAAKIKIFMNVLGDDIKTKPEESLTEEYNAHSLGVDELSPDISHVLAVSIFKDLLLSIRKNAVKV